MKFSDELLNWYDANKRDLPWRNTDNPYVIWITEVVFQQTRIAQGLPYFLKFIEKFPTVQHLARAKEEDVLKFWQGLGYYSRARNLHFSAKYIVNDLAGKFPKTYKDLLKLKGVGPYIAAEVASVCYGEKVAAVDGNVQRVLARYFGIEEAVNEKIGAKLVQDFANAHIPTNRPGDFNQALMDFGSSICAPKKPVCEDCIFNASCWALRNNRVGSLPLKVKKVKVRKRVFNYYLSICDDKLPVYKRVAGDVWQGLFEPLMTEQKTKQDKIALDEVVSKGNGYLLHSSKRILSHQNIEMNFWVINEIPIEMDSFTIRWASLEELLQFPVSKSIEELFSLAKFKDLFI